MTFKFHIYINQLFNVKVRLNNTSALLHQFVEIQDSAKRLLTSLHSFTVTNNHIQHLSKRYFMSIQTPCLRLCKRHGQVGKKQCTVYQNLPVNYNCLCVLSATTPYGQLMTFACSLLIDGNRFLQLALIFVIALTLFLFFFSITCNCPSNNIEALNPT